MSKMRKFGGKTMLLLCLLSLLLPVLPAGFLPDAAARELGDDLMLNGNFEQSSAGAPLNWVPFEGWSNPELSLTASAARSGTYGLQLSTALTNRNPWVRQQIAIQEGETYKLSSWIKGTGVTGSGPGFKLEFYKGGSTTSANHLDYDSLYQIKTSQLTGEWQPLEFTIEAPKEATAVIIYVRLYGIGTAFFDDIRFTLDKYRKMIDLSTDETFYYSDRNEGHVRAQFQSHDGVLNDKRVEARIVRESTGVPITVSASTYADQPFDLTFDPSLMVKQEPYLVELRLLDALGQELERAEDRIFRFDRPQMLTENGTLQVDNEPFFPILAYHVSLSDYPYVGLAGVNTVQANGTNNPNTMRNMLDTAQHYGLKVAVPLYYDMKVHENMGLIEQFVTEFKSHPAVLAWMMMDEPVTNKKTKEELVNAYRLIRTLDPVHPIYMVEAPASAYEFTANLTDIFAIDVYPIPYMPLSTIGERTALAKQAAGSTKPVMNILQAMYNPPVWTILPTIAQIRNMAYQGITNGSQGLGYYSFNENGFALRQSALWPGLTAFREETDLLGELITGKAKWGGGQGPDTQWTAWQDGDEKVVAMVNTANESRVVSVPLDVTGFRATLLYGDTQAERDIPNDTLTVELGPLQSLLYRITPFTHRVVEADQRLQAIASLSADPAWTSGVSDLDDALGQITASLSASTPDVAQAAEDALSALTIADSLIDWAQASAGTAAAQMKDGLANIRSLLGPIAASPVSLSLQMSGGQIIGQGETNTLSMTVRNPSDSSLNSLQVKASLPAEFGLSPLQWSQASLGTGLEAAGTLAFQLTEAIDQGRYPLRATLSFEYADHPGTRVSVDYSIRYPYINLVEATLAPGSIQAHAGQTIPFTVQLASSASHPTEIGLVPSFPTGWTVQLPSLTTVSAGQTLSVTGSIYVPTNVTDQVYTPAIDVRLGGIPIRSLTLPVEVNNNLLRNPGFEKPNLLATAPENWTMRVGQWQQGAGRSGEYAVALLPDPANDWNVIVSDMVPVQPGTRYELLAWTKSASTSGVSIGLRESKNNGASSIRYEWKPVAASADWTLNRIELTPRPDTTQLQVYLKADPVADGLSQFDDFYLKAIPK
ncbi:carbohydrate binding domain-containing protein [Paenibacillus hodogayensis]|uniref:Carbohydrate binding domain-containing protein n=1 Tax=Paenibacillus hodogayensis TaxID=279208 RepID=A0ABV5W678_9BACL